MNSKAMTVLDAIHANRAARSFLPDVVDQPTIQKLLEAAVQAPTAMHLEPWAFAVVQDAVKLKRLSDRAKELIIEHADSFPAEKRDHFIQRAQDPSFNVFYNANTLVVLYGKPIGLFVQADCWLATENLLLAACHFGLGGCVIGLAINALNTPEWKAALGVPAAYTAYAPIILGFPEGEAPAKTRRKPEVFSV